MSSQKTSAFWKGFWSGWAKGFIILSPIIGYIVWEIVK